jgi:hypothetical protein
MVFGGVLLCDMIRGGVEPKHRPRGIARNEAKDRENHHRHPEEDGHRNDEAFY